MSLEAPELVCESGGGIFCEMLQNGAAVAVHDWNKKFLREIRGLTLIHS